MNSPDETLIEALLRRAPQPQPAGALKENLLAQVKSAPRRAATAAEPVAALSAPAGWFRRWWPALVPGALSLVCAAVMTVQQIEIRGLKQDLQNLSAANAVPAVASQPHDVATPAAAIADDATEVAHLKEVVAGLNVEIAQLEKLRAENLALRSQLSAPAISGLTPEESAGMEEMQKAKERAQRIACVNNMKQLGISARIWAGDNNDKYPTDIISMSNEMSTPKILVCPADTGHRVATDFSSFSPGANCSYEWYLSPPGSDAEPTRVLTRCPIHNNVGLYDGSVQMIGTNQLNWLVQRDGKLYYENPASNGGPP